MNFPKGMLSWKSGNLGLTLLGVWFILAAFISYSHYGGVSFLSSPSQGVFTFGAMFFAVALINGESRPTVLGAVISMLLGLSYFMGFIANVNISILWTLVLGLFAVLLVLEFGIFRFGPSNSKAKVLTIVPLAVLAFAFLLGLVGYGPSYAAFPWSTAFMTALGSMVVLALCWIYVFDYVGYRPFKGRTNLWLNILPIIAVLLNIVGMAQGLNALNWLVLVLHL